MITATGTQEAQWSTCANARLRGEQDDSVERALWRPVSESPLPPSSNPAGISSAARFEAPE